MPILLAIIISSMPEGLIVHKVLHLESRSIMLYIKEFSKQLGTPLNSTVVAQLTINII